jgi:tRNA(Ile)-lysidine synthase TilS/MesJ
MISEGDRIAVGVSGGKDSLSTLWALANLRRFYPVRFEVEAITVDMGFEGMDLSPIKTFCDGLDCRLHIVKTQIKEIVFDIRKESNPCSLCAKMRRGSVNSAAVEAGCNKIALGHHFDDAVETFLMSLIYEGRISCFQPVTWLDRKKVTVIRPLLYTPESMTVKAAAELAFPIVKSTCTADGYTKRQEIKELIEGMKKSYPDLKNKVFGAMCRYPLGGWERNAGSILPEFMKE